MAKPPQNDFVVKKTLIAKEVAKTLPAKQHIDPTMPKSTWEEVESIYQTCANGIVDILDFTQKTNTVLLIKPEEVKPEITTCIRGLTRDLNELSKTLVRIHKNHETRSGVIESDLDHKLSMDIMQDYIGFNERFKTVVVTPITILSTEVAEISQKLLDEEMSKKVNQPAEEVKA